jgi:glycosyltransferase involved in cell wall biosynthesis
MGLSNGSMAKVSVVTPSYNQGQFIEKTIRSVLCQDYPQVEYIVVDGLSSDHTAEILQQYSHQVDRVIIEPDKGQTDALNKGFKLCTGDIIAYINSDDCYADANVFSRMVAYLEDHPEVDVVYGRRRFIGEKGYFELSNPHREFSQQDLYSSCYIPQECVFWRRSLFEKAGFHVDEMLSFAMDYELWLRFLSHGAKFAAVDDFWGFYRYYPGQKSNAIWREKGLPEIAKLHKMYTGRSLPELEMIAAYHEYLHGLSPVFEGPAFFSCYQMWFGMMYYQKQVVSRVPIDEWMLRAPLRPNQPSLDTSHGITV